MSNLIQYAYEGTPVFFQSDAYLNATSIASKFGKKPKDYLILDSTKAYIAAVTRKLVTNENQDVMANDSKGRNPLFEKNQIVITKKGAPENGGGTWLHPKLSVDFARWLNPDFAVWCDDQINAIINGTSPEKPTKQAFDGCLTLEQQDTIKALVKSRAEALPKSCRAKASITMWSAIKTKFGCSYKVVDTKEYLNVVALVSRLPLEGELLPPPEPVTPDNEIYSKREYLENYLKSLSEFLPMVEYDKLCEATRAYIATTLGRPNVLQLTNSELLKVTQRICMLTSIAASNEAHQRKLQDWICKQLSENNDSSAELPEYLQGTFKQIEGNYVSHRAFGRI